ncbi:hypothetical protein [Streptomyces sp. NEAU-174]|uniref:hypothetical protein n=1 Tax=Streptomyces sp. NEAU-174 TaxID=3458254 RepID=UPI004044C9B8
MAERELRTETERDEARPDMERDSRPDTERRDEEERAERDRPEVPDEESRPVAEEPPLRADEPSLRDEELPPGPGWPVIPVGGEATIPCGETTGAIPQTSQYSSPPPTSS